MNEDKKQVRDFWNQAAGELAGAEKVILPGVGAFDWAMSRLEESGMRACLDELALEKKRPVLGICVGMQMMAGRSDEGVLDGLGWIKGDIRKFNEKSVVSGRWSVVLPMRKAVFSQINIDIFPITRYYPQTWACKRYSIHD